MFWIVTYDIPDDKRRRKVAKLLEGFGRRAQYSVFECDLKKEDYNRMKSRLKKLVNPRQDNIRFYLISADDVKRRQVWGVDRGEVEVRAWYMVKDNK